MKKYFPMRIIFLLLLFAIEIILIYPTLCESENPSDWSANPCYTHQSWDFEATGKDKKGKWISPQKPFLPDAKLPVVNPYGIPDYTNYAAEKKYFDWTYTPMHMKGWFRHGMWGSMGPGAPAGLIFNIPNHENIKLQTRLSLQYIICQYRGAEFTTLVYASDNKPFIMTARNKKKIDSGGGSGIWFKITEIWEISPSPPLLYVKLEITRNMGLIDQVSIKTQCIPVKSFHK